MRITVYQAVKMGVLDSIADFNLDGDLFQDEKPKLKKSPRLTKKEVKIVVTEPEDSDMSRR